MTETSLWRNDENYYKMDSFTIQKEKRKEK